MLKNLSNLLTMGGDYLFFGRTYGLAVSAHSMGMLADLCPAAAALSAACALHVVQDLPWWLPSVPCPSNE